LVKSIQAADSVADAQAVNLRKVAKKTFEKRSDLEVMTRLWGVITSQL